MAEPETFHLYNVPYYVTEQKTPAKNQLIEPKPRTKPPAVMIPEIPARAAALAEAATPGEPSALTEPKTPAMSEARTPGNAAVLTEPKTPAESHCAETRTPGKAPLVALMADVSLFWLMGVFTVFCPTMVSAPISGIPASAYTFPYIAGLIDEKAQVNFIPFCTGTILTAKWVLTTYGCIKRPGRGRRRRNDLEPQDVVMIFGTGFTPSRTYLVDRLIPNFDRYPHRRGEQFIFPNQDDLQDAFDNDPDIEEILNSNNEYIAEDRFGHKYTRYYIDFAAIELDRDLKWTDQVVPAIYPLQGKRLTRTWWKKKVQDFKSGIEFMETCYLVGWGGWIEAFQYRMRLRYTQVKYVPYDNCELTYCNECSYCNKTWRVNWKHQTCYKSLLYADGCNEDEGAPVWCPWAGITTTRQGQKFDTGAVLGLLSYATSCYGKSVPSIYANSWQAFQMISRAVGYDFPPSILIFEDVLEDPPEAHLSRERNKDLIEQ